MPTQASERVYNGRLAVATVNGQEIVGPGDTDYVSISWNNDLAAPTPGLDGAVSLDILNDKTAVATVTLMKGSRGSVLLDGYRRLFENAEPGSVFEFAVRYIPTGETWVARSAWVQTRPDVVFGSTAGTEEWGVGLARVEGDRFELPSLAG